MSCLLEQEGVEAVFATSEQFEQALDDMQRMLNAEAKGEEDKEAIERSIAYARRMGYVQQVILGPQTACLFEQYNITGQFFCLVLKQFADRLLPLIAGCGQYRCQHCYAKAVSLCGIGRN